MPDPYDFDLYGDDYGDEEGPPSRRRFDPHRFLQWMRETYRLAPLDNEIVARVTDALPVDLRMSLVAFPAAVAGGFVRDRISRTPSADIDLFLRDVGQARVLAHLLAMSRGVRPRRDMSYLSPRRAGENISDQIRRTGLAYFQPEPGRFGMPHEVSAGTFLVPGPLPVHVVGTISTQGEGTPQSVQTAWLLGLFVGFDISAGAAAVYWRPDRAAHEGAVIPNVEYDIRHRNLRYLRIGMKANVRSNRIRRLLDRTVRLMRAGWSIRPGEVSVLNRALEGKRLSAEEQQLYTYIQSRTQRHDQAILAALEMPAAPAPTSPTETALPADQIRTYAKTQRNLGRPMDLPASQLGLAPEGAIDVAKLNVEGWTVAMRTLVALVHDVLVYLLPYRVWLDAQPASQRNPGLSTLHQDDQLLSRLELAMAFVPHEAGVPRPAVPAMPAPPERHPWTQLAERLEHFHALPRWNEEGAETLEYSQARSNLLGQTPPPWRAVIGRLADLDRTLREGTLPATGGPSLHGAHQVLNGLAILMTGYTSGVEPLFAETSDRAAGWLTMAWFTQIQLAMPVRTGIEALGDVSPRPARKKRSRRGRAQGQGEVSGRR